MTHFSSEAPLTMTGLPDPHMNADLYAGVTFKRGVAWVIDVIVTVLLTAIVVPFTAFIGLFFLPFLYLVVSFVYRWVTLARGSATLGMRLAAIELRNREGRRFDSAEAALHTLGYTLSFAVFPAQIVSIALMLISDKGQGLTDHIMGSAALNLRAGR